MTEFDVAVEMPTPKVTERAAWDLNGWPVAFVTFVLLVAGVVQFSVGIANGQDGMVALGIVLFVVGVIVAAGLTAVSPDGPGCCRSSAGTPERSAPTACAG